MHRRFWPLRRAAAALLALTALALTGCGASGAVSSSAGAAPASSAVAAGPVARVEGKSFCIRGSDGTYTPTFINGVNLGAAKAGYFPGEFAVTKADYLRWFQEISAMNVHTIRVYVNQMPEFYQALREFNLRADSPLYLFQGVYVNEELTARYADAFGGGGAIVDAFARDIRSAVDMIHGQAEVKKRAGNAGGTYTSDVSPWVIGWILGIEWSAELVEGTNTAHADKTAFSGTYVRTQGASPFEVFLAQAAETAVSWEMERYGTQRPVALCNWCTTDPLSHPNEPIPETEDAVSVDPEHLRATDAFAAGFFAAYHVYPYYPDFFSYDTKYLDGVAPDPYLAYLKELNAYHTMPVLIAEYGIPASRGVAHINAVTGMSQGHASESQQGRWLIALNRDIRAAGCAGGLIFSWQDEWFKRTWNSVDYEVDERRPFWLNLESPEENFGLLAFVPGKSKAVVTLDGSAKEWSGAPVTENDGVRVWAASDAAALYLRIEAENYDFERDTLYLPLDVLAGQGNTAFGGLSFAQGAEFLLRLHGRDDSTLLTDAYYDAFQYDYAERYSLFPAVPGQTQKNSGCFDPIYQALSFPLILPRTGQTTEFQRFDTGALHYGSGDPESEDYDSLADFCAADGTVELRLPWMLLGYMDPSQKQVMGDFHGQSAIPAADSDGVRIGVCRAQSAGVTPMALYTWDNWEIPETHERLKQSYRLLQDYFAENG